MTRRFLTPLSTNHVDFNISHPSTPDIGRVFWNSEEGTLDLGMNDEVVQAIGMQFYMPPTNNNSGVEIPKGSFVMATGVQGDRITIAKAVTNGSVNPEYMIGFAAQTIGIGSETGLIVTHGTIKNINTSLWPVGTILYSSPASAGLLTASVPSSPSIKIPIAIVLRQHENTGRIYVRLDLGKYLSTNMDDVQTTSLLDNDILSYNTSASAWVNQNLATAIGEIDGTGSGIDADLLDGQHGSHYLDWNNTTNKPDPTITLLGDVSGSATFTDLTSASVNVTIQPNSVELGTDTTGNYVATASAGSGIEISGSGSENADLTIINTGVTSLTGTANEVEVSASAGAVQVGLPNNVRIESLSSGTASVDVSYASDIFVAVAYYSAAASSTDGITWTPRTLPSSQDWISLSYGNNTFVAVARSSAAAATSTDGTTWTARTLPSSQNWRSVTYGNGEFFAVARSSAAAASSTDGITWTNRTLSSSAQWQEVEYGNNTFVVVAQSLAASYSTDGVTWTARSLPSSAQWQSVTHGNNTFVVVVGGNSAAAATSTDGITWTARTLPSSQYWSSVTYGNDIFVAVSYNLAAATSTDGITWTARTLSSSAGWSSVAYGTPAVLTPTPISPNLVPTQTGNSGKYLTTDGTTSSWGTIDLSGYQPLDGDLTSIAGLSGSAGLLRKTDLNTFTLDTATYLTGNETITLSGDATGSGTTSISLTLANSGVSAATYGSASAVPTVAIDVKGRVTSASATPIAIAQSAVTNLTTDLALKANLASPTFTGTPAAPTAAAGTNTTQIATTAFVQQEKPTIHPMFMIGGV